ncbi:MAG: SHOCT domain-containing protein [Muribaculaceae bacterium]|nr:SHOCT domain-containing protein [Muribaculaceae bacterium]
MTVTEQIAKLKALLDAGALTQKEFEVAKNRILDVDEHSVQVEAAQNTLTQDKSETEDISNNPEAEILLKDPTKTNTHTKRNIIIGLFVGFIIIFVFAMIISTNMSSSSEREYPSYAMSENDTELSEIPVDAYSEDVDDNSFNNSTGPWRKDYFKNEWGEPDTHDPFIMAVLSGDAWNVHVDYLPAYSTDSEFGVFRLFLLDRHGSLTSMREPVNIVVRGADGETRYVPVSSVSERGIAYVTEPSAVQGLIMYFDDGQFDIRLDFEKYLEKHHTIASYYGYEGDFKRAVLNMLY